MKGMGRKRRWAGARRHKEQRERAKSKHPDVYTMQPTQPTCGQRDQERKGREEVQEEKQKGQERRKVTEEGGVGRGSRQEHHMLQKAPGPGFAAVLASAVSVSDSWLGAGPYPRAACPAATPLPRAGSHPSPAHSTGRVTQAGAGDPDQHATLESLQREGISVQTGMSRHPGKTQLPCKTQMCAPRAPLHGSTCPVNTPVPTTRGIT